MFGRYIEDQERNFYADSSHPVGRIKRHTDDAVIRALSAQVQEQAETIKKLVAELNRRPALAVADPEPDPILAAIAVTDAARRKGGTR